MSTNAGLKRPYAPRMSPEERRDQILDAALDVIVKEGVGGVSVDGIARMIGVTRPVVYSVFTDSDHILRASLEREEVRALAQIQDLLEAARTSNRSIPTLVSTYLEAVLAEPKRWRAILLPVGYAPPFLKRLQRARSQLAVEVESIMRRAMPAGYDAALAARAVVALLEEAGRMVLTEGDTFSKERIASFAATISGS